MSYCKKCHKHISADCFLDIGVCVFCYYKTDEWESNGTIVTKKEAIKKLLFPRSNKRKSSK